jgi:AcrR family transcriptional regulator
MTEASARVAAPASRRRGPASTEDGQRSRDRILKAALDLITEAGIDQVRVAGIAQRAGMSTGQVMYYFTSKEHILLETLAWQEHQDTATRLAKITGAWRQLDRFIGHYLPDSPTDPVWILWMEAWARAPHSAEVSQFMEELLRPWREELAAIVAHGVDEGAFVPPGAIDDFTLRFVALLDGLALQRLRQLHQLSRKRAIELAMYAARAELTPRSQNTEP